jgi:hypothetical protein
VECRLRKHRAKGNGTRKQRQKLYIQVAVRYGIALQRGEIMLTNADVTIYEKDSCTAHLISDVYLNDSRGRTVSKNGIQISDSVILYIYSDEYIPKAGDMFVNGLTDFEFDCTDEKSISESMKLFRTAFPDFAVVKSVNNAMYGGLPHIEIIAR